jgi:hypothetical protein
MTHIEATGVWGSMAWLQGEEGEPWAVEIKLLFLCGCLHLWNNKSINRIVTTGLQTIYMNFTNIHCIMQNSQCCVQVLLIALLVLTDLRMQRGIQYIWMQRGIQYTWMQVVQSHDRNFPVQWFINSSARLTVVPAKWSKCSHRTNFHASLQDNVEE